MYTLIDKNDKYIEMAEGENKMLVPSKAAIIVDDESTITTVKTIASRRTLASIDTSTPPPPTPIDYSKQYLTFVALEDGTFKFSGNSISYSLDSGNTWSTLASNTDSPTITSGNKIMWKASLTPSSGIGRFSSTSQFDVEGNAMSLLHGDDFSGETSLNGKNYVFYHLFYNCTTVASAENLSLPATTLANYCYYCMFEGCTSLTVAPQLQATALADDCYNGMFSGCTALTTAMSILPATTLVKECYMQMFRGCTSLTTAPQLPATTLVDNCYGSMFNSCTSLTTAPLLPATELAKYCYNFMFYNCTNLNNITCLATRITSQNCTNGWVNGVSSSGTFTKAASMESWTRGNKGIPNNWTVVDA